MFMDGMEETRGMYKNEWKNVLNNNEFLGVMAIL